MVNLLDQLQSNKTCQVCGKRKPLPNFVIGQSAQGKFLYSQICTACRKEQAEDDEGGGGKQNTLTLDHNKKEALMEAQEELEKKRAESKEDYFKEHDETLEKREREKAEKDFSRRKKSFLDAFQEPSTLPNNFLDSEKDWSKSTDQDASLSTEYSFDPNIHDPLRQTPNARHHQIFATHPDRVDVKFLLEYILSGDYAQHYTTLIGPSRHHRYTTPKSVSISSPDRPVKTAHTTETNRQNFNTTRSGFTASQHITNATPASTFAISVRTAVIQGATIIAPAATALSNPTQQATSAATVTQQFQPVATNQLSTATTHNPSLFSPGSSQATFIHNTSQPIGCKFMESMPQQYSSNFQHFRYNQSVNEPSEQTARKPNQIMSFSKK